MQSGNRRRVGARGGFTLIELMIALGILLVGLLALWSLQATAVANTSNAYRLGLATTLAQDTLEQLEEAVLAVNGESTLFTTCTGAIPADPTNPLAELPCAYDDIRMGSVGLFVNAMGSLDASLGPVIFRRTYLNEDISTGTMPRYRITVRVTYFDTATNKTHGVTVATTRSADRYNPANPPGT